MRFALLLLLAAPAMHFDVTDARGKKPAGIAIEAGPPDADGWCKLSLLSKTKGEPVLIWPYDGRAKMPDGPEGIPVIVVEKGDARASANPKVAAAVRAGSILGATHEIGVRMNAAASDDAFAKGVDLLAVGKYGEAMEPLGRALKERERQLTRVPSEIYPAAMLYGKALFGAGKFDDAAVAFLKALKQRPSDMAARKARAEALIKAGKPEAAQAPVE